MLVPSSGAASTRNIGDVGDPRERLMGRSRISTNGVLFGVRATGGGQKVISQRDALTGYEQYVVLWRVDDVVAIAQAASHQCNVAIAAPCACDDLSGGTIGIKNAISAMRYAHLLAVLQGARNRRLRFLNNAAVARLAAFSCKPVDANGRMVQAIRFVLRMIATASS